MERLTNKDLRTLLGFLQQCYRFCNLDTFARQIVSTLPNLVPSEITSYNEVNMRRQRNAYLTNPPNTPTAKENTIFLQHMHQHPLITRYQRTRDAHTFKISDFLTTIQFQRLALYNEFYRPLAIEHQMAFALPTARFLIVGFALNRGERDFAERDRLILNLLRPHLVQAYHNAESVTQLQGQLALVRDSLEKLDQGVVVFTGAGRVSLANSRARDCMRGYFGESSLKNHCLPEELQRWIKHQGDLLEQTDDVPTPCKPYIVEREGKRLTVRLVSDEGRRVLVFKEQLIEIQPTLLEPLGLSQREAEILTWVAYGKTNAEIGLILGLSPRTVQKHLEHIFQKLGVETRTAAAAQALSVIGHS